MTNTLSKTQRLVLFKLLFTGDEPKQSEIRPELKAKDRNELVRAGLITLEPRGRAKIVLLTDKAWDWASAHLDSELMGSKYATEVLEAVLRRLNTYLRARSMSLADLFQSQDSAAQASDSQGIRDRIRNTYLELSAGRYGQPVRLADLKGVLAGISPESIDSTLLSMQQAGDLSLQSLEDPRQLSDADHKAAIRIVGHERHLVYLEK